MTRRAPSVLHLAPELADIVDSWPGGQFAQLRAETIAKIRDEQLALARSIPIVDETRAAWGDVRIPGFDSDAEIPLRIYRPVQAPDSCAALVYFHGGAFAMGSVESEHRRTLSFAAELDAVIVSVEYRLAPEHPFPAGLDDGYAALQWVSRQAARLGIDRSRIGIGGASAGGCIAAAVALRARDESGPPLVCQCLIYPVLDDRLQSSSMIRFADAPVFNLADARFMWQMYLNGGTANAYAAPARAHDLSQLPPAYVMTAELDPLRDEAMDYASRLMRSGVTVELHNVAGAVHGFDVLVEGTLATFARSAQIDAMKRLLARGSRAA